MNDGRSAFLVSATYLASTLRAMERLKLLDERVKARLGPEQTEFLTQPHARTWWSGSALVQLTAVIGELQGPAPLEEVGYLTVKDGVGPIIAPMVSVIGAIFGFSPSSFFTRMADLASTSIRGVSIVFADRPPTGGLLTVKYPCEVSRVGIEPLWRGAARYVFDVARAKGSVARCGGEGPTFELEVSWSPKS